MVRRNLTTEFFAHRFAAIRKPALIRFGDELDARSDQQSTDRQRLPRRNGEPISLLYEVVSAASLHIQQLVQVHSLVRGTSRRRGIMHAVVGDATEL